MLEYILTGRHPDPQCDPPGRLCWLYRFFFGRVIGEFVTTMITTKVLLAAPLAAPLLATAPGWAIDGLSDWLTERVMGLGPSPCQAADHAIPDDPRPSVVELGYQLLTRATRQALGLDDEPGSRTDAA